MSMSSSSPSPTILISSIALLLASSAATSCCYTSVFSFGDSITDTGNKLISANGFKPFPVGNEPYGETYFHHPTGRYCDGRIILDFIAEALGLPLLPPYLAGGREYERGVNLAMGGATALDNDFFRAMGMDVYWTNYSLGVQLDWFKHSVLPSLCTSHSDCQNALSKSLFIVGEIGGDDYNHPFFDPFLVKRNFDDIRAFVPKIIHKISSTINELIELGARTLIVPGNFPIGCLPTYLTLYANADTSAGDIDPRTGCVNWLNDFSKHHNRRLLEALDHLRDRHPHATIIYADYYNTAMSIIRSPNPFGYGVAPLAACCGVGGGKYNYNASEPCGTGVATVCDDPSRYVSWDGVHFTEAAYRLMAAGLLNGSFTFPPISLVCPGLQQPPPASINRGHQPMDLHSVI